MDILLKWGSHRLSIPDNCCSFLFCLLCTSHLLISLCVCSMQIPNPLYFSNYLIATLCSQHSLCLQMSVPKKREIVSEVWKFEEYYPSCSPNSNFVNKSIKVELSLVLLSTLKSFSNKTRQ